MKRSRWLAPAKVNLALHVTGRRADGYHTLETLAVFADHGDLLTVEATGHDTFAIAGPYAAGLAAEPSNLVVRARDTLRLACRGHPAPPVSITLEKNLPVASGIGGGSSDAAAALTALAERWDAPLGAEELAALGVTLGADVPMCLAARPLIARGAGEQIEPLARWPALHLVLANPGVAVSTAEVFSLLASRENPPLPPLPQAADFGAVRQWLRETRNDLQLAARSLAPSIGDALHALEASGAAFARMSGSGATCFGLYESAAAAQKAADKISTAQPDWFVMATRTGGNENDAN